MRKPFKIMFGIIVGFMCLGAAVSFTQSKSSTNAVTAEQSNNGPSSDSTANEDAAFPADEKEFAHRYNQVADQAWKITNIAPNQGFDTLQMPDGSYIDVEGSRYRLDPNWQKHIPDASIITICQWMIKAASPSISLADAQSTATKVATNKSPSHNVDIVVADIVVEGSRDTPCTISPTGL